MMAWLLIIGVILLGLMLSAFFSGAETGIYCIGRPRLHLAAQRLDPKALRLERMLDDEAGALSVTLIGTNLMNYITTTACAFMFAELIGFSELNTELYTVVFLTPIVFVFGEVVPKNLFRLHAETLMLRGGWLLAVASRLFRCAGAVWCSTHLVTIASWAGGERHPVSSASRGPKRRVALLLQDALAGGPLGQDQSELIDRVCQLSETPVHVAMVPRNRVVVIAATADRRELLRLARRTTHTQVPVFDSQRRHIMGLITIDDLVQADDWTTVGDRVERAMTMNPHDMVPSAITRMQQAGCGLAVVADRGGRMLGVVTLRDLLAEVVGELGNDV
ncbi:MAG: CNNM domain-containing protein [Planctomycetota bacterium]|jgi:CBS domain containing-hemolysin-like protein